MALLRLEASSARHAFDHAGDSVSMGAGEFRTLRWSGYWEHGLTTRWTTFGQLEGASSRKLDSVSGDGPRDSGIDGLLLGLRRSVPTGHAFDQAACGAFVQLVSSGSRSPQGGIPRQLGFGCNYAHATSHTAWLHGGAEIRWAGDIGAQSRLRGEFLFDAMRGGQWSLGAEQRLSLHHGGAALDEDRTRLHARLSAPFHPSAARISGWQIGVEQDVAGRNTLRATSIVAGITLSW